MSKIITGARVSGSVQHVITTSAAFNVSACGRVVIPGMGEGLRVCKTCVRVSDEGFKLDAAMRKAARDTRIQQSLPSSVQGEEFSTWEWELSEEEWVITLEKIDKINERCAKKGIPGGLKVEFTKELKKKYNSILDKEIEVSVYLTKVTGIPPQLPGWSFIATLDYDAHAGLIVRGYPGAAPVDRTALREAWCDHCQTTRYRKATYVMRNDETGEQVQVGSACIKDFTGWTAMPYSFERLQSDMEFAGGFGKGPRDVTVLTALAIAWAAVTEYGFVRSNEPNCTKGVVMDVIDPPKPNKHNADYLADLRRLAKYSEEMDERAKELRAFILSDDFKLSDRSDYPANMKAICSAEKVSFRNLGLLVSAPQAWARFLEWSLIRKVEKEESTSKHVGSIKERREFMLTVESEKYIPTDFKTSILYRMLDAEGNVFKWFASREVLDGCVGKTVTLVGTIIKHGEWKGVKETSINRCKLVSVQE